MTGLSRRPARWTAAQTVLRNASPTGRPWQRAPARIASPGPARRPATPPPAPWRPKQPPPPTGSARPPFVNQEFLPRLIHLRNPLSPNGLELIPTTEPDTTQAAPRQGLFVSPHPRRGPLPTHPKNVQQEDEADAVHLVGRFFWRPAAPLILNVRLIRRNHGTRWREPACVLARNLTPEVNFENICLQACANGA